MTRVVILPKAWSAMASVRPELVNAHLFPLSFRTNDAFMWSKLFVRSSETTGFAFGGGEVAICTARFDGTGFRGGSDGCAAIRGEGSASGGAESGLIGTMPLCFC